MNYLWHITILLVGLMLGATYYMPNPAHSIPSPLVEGQTIYKETLDIDPLPVTSIRHDPSQIKTVKRLANGIINYKEYRTRGIPGTKQGDIIWYECGKKYETQEEMQSASLKWAWSLAEAAKRISDKRFTLNVWGLAGTAANESWFDRCALGTGPRKWAYRKKLLKKNLGQSHPREKILQLIRDKAFHRRWKRAGIDVGMCQILTKYYPGTPEDMLTLGGGSRVCAEEMRLRARKFHISRPWLTWQGGKKSWYDKKVTRIARRFLGAKRGEI